MFRGQARGLSICGDRFFEAQVTHMPVSKGGPSIGIFRVEF